MVLFPNQSKSVETGAQYKLPSTSSIVSRNLVKVLPSNGTSFTASNQITIEIPSVDFLDVSGSFLSFKIKTDASKTLADDNSQGWIERVRISTGRNEVLCDIQNYNLLNGVVETLLSHKTYKENAGDVLEGTATTDVTTAQRRCIQLLGGVLDNNATFFPLKYTNGLIIDIFITTESKAGGAAAATGLTISDVSYACEFVKMDAQYTSAFEEQFLSSGIKYVFDTYTTSQSTISTTNVNKQITENVKSLKTVYAIQQQATDPINVFRQARTASVLFKYGNTYVPSQAISCTDGGAEMFKETQKAVNLSGDQSFDIDINKASWSDSTDVATTGKKFIIGQNFELSPSQSMSGADATRKPLSIALTYSADGTNLKNPATTSVTLTTFVHYDVIAIFGANGTQIIY